MRVALLAAGVGVAVGFAGLVGAAEGTLVGDASVDAVVGTSVAGVSVGAVASVLIAVVVSSVGASVGLLSGAEVKVGRRVAVGVGVMRAS
jgi:hypothetical protein